MTTQSFRRNAAQRVLANLKSTYARLMKDMKDGKPPDRDAIETYNHSLGVAESQSISGLPPTMGTGPYDVGVVGKISRGAGYIAHSNARHEKTKKMNDDVMVGLLKKASGIK